MDDCFIVASHISPLTLPYSFVVQTARQNAPSLGAQDNDLPVDHAISSTTLTTVKAGTILLRVIHGGLIIELISLTTSVPPLRVVFPAAVLPNPAIFLWKDSELHLILATDSCSLFRIVIPIDGLKLWQNRVERIWPREYSIRNIPAERVRECAVHVQGIYSVAVCLPNGVLLRLEAESMGYDGHDGKPYFSSETKHEFEGFFDILRRMD